MSNAASFDGGAIYGNGFNSIKVKGNTKFSENTAANSGDDFFAANTETALLL